MSVERRKNDALHFIDIMQVHKTNLHIRISLFVIVFHEKEVPFHAICKNNDVR